MSRMERYVLFILGKFTGVVRTLSRSISETVNSMVIARFRASLRKRLDARKVAETRLKNVAHNISQNWVL